MSNCGGRSFWLIETAIINTFLLHINDPYLKKACETMSFQENSMKELIGKCMKFEEKKNLKIGKPKSALYTVIINLENKG